MSKLALLNSFLGTAMIIYIIAGIPIVLLVSFFIFVGELFGFNQINPDIKYLLLTVVTFILTIVFNIKVIGNIIGFWSIGKMIKLSQFFMVLGHLGVLSAILLVSHTGLETGVGFALFPSFFWTLLWYFLGGVLVIIVAATKYREQHNA
jgi:hypothetical protein